MLYVKDSNQKLYCEW